MDDDISFMKILAQAEQLIRFVNDLIEGELTRKGVTDIAPCTGDIFFYLYEHGSCTLTEIAEQTSRAKPTASLTMKALVGRGYIEKRKSEEDSRCCMFYLTEKGLALQPTFEKIRRKLNCRTRCGLSPEEIRTLETLLNKSYITLSIPKPKCNCGCDCGCNDPDSL